MLIIIYSCRFEDYVDQRYKEHLKNQGKADSVSSYNLTIIRIANNKPISQLCLASTV